MPSLHSNRKEAIVAVKRTKSRGRDLKHTETQAALNVSRKVSGERGRTDGRESIGAVSAASPKLQRKSPSLKRSPNMTRDDLINGEKSREHYPDVYHVTKRGVVKMRTYYRVPNSEA
jgi:hypothetical protein